MVRRLRNPEDTGKTVATVALIGAAAYGLYKVFVKPEEPGVPSKLIIISYQNMRTGETRESNDILDVNIGDTIRINFEYGYFGPAINGKYHVAVWKSTFGQTHDEFASKDETFSLLETLEKQVIKKSIDLVVESFDMTPDMYGLYVKIMGIPGGDIHYYLANVIRVEGGAPDTGTGWLLPNTELTRKIFTFSVGTEVPPGTWLLPNTELARKIFSFTVGTEIPPGIWLPANTELARKIFAFSVTTALISFQMGIWGVPDFGSYDYWTCYYWNPETSKFVGTGGWVSPSSYIKFEYVKTGGYLAVFLAKGSTVSKQYISKVFYPVNNGVYRYDVQIDYFYSY